MRTVKQIAQAEFDKKPNQLVPNVVSKVFAFTEKVKKQLELEGYDVAYVGKTAPEGQYTPKNFTPRDVNGFWITGVSHDALFVDDEQYDLVAAGNDSDEAIRDVASVNGGTIPKEYWRKENPRIKDLVVAGKPSPSVPSPVAPSPQLKDRDQFFKELKELNDFYEAFDGLQRPGGMVINGRADVEALGSWGYNLLTGKTVEECKAEIRNSFEWRAKH